MVRTLQLKYKKILIKISGEALAGDSKFGINFTMVNKVCSQIKTCWEMGAKIGVVVGGGNFWRGREGTGMDRTRADHMGMLATVMNSIALQDALEQLGVPTRVQTAIEMRQIAEPYIRNKAVSHLNKNRVVIFGCGIGNPFFSTDTAAALRAIEIEAEIILLAKKVDGIYTDDPAKNPEAKKLDRLTYFGILERGLGVMDNTATTLCMDNKIPLLVFGLGEENSIVKAVSGENIGTIVKEEN